jgi:hypothetical protein
MSNAGIYEGNTIQYVPFVLQYNTNKVATLRELFKTTPMKVKIEHFEAKSQNKNPASTDIKGALI